MRVPAHSPSYEGGGGKATSNASGADSSAEADASNGGTGKATAKDGNDDVHAEALAACKATANGSGAGGAATADCTKAGSIVTATATKGSVAEGSDTGASLCVAKNGGHAEVKSPFDGGCSD